MSVKTQHTPGPWFVTEGDAIRVRQESTDWVLATIEDGTHPDIQLIPWAVQVANARLIAAAPDLLRAAEAALIFLDCLDQAERVRALLLSAIGRVRAQ